MMNDHKIYDMLPYETEGDRITTMASIRILQILTFCLALIAFSYPAYATSARESAREKEPEVLDEKPNPEAEKKRKDEDESAKELRTEERLSLCAKTTDRVSRLICYDTLAKDMGYVPEDVAVQEEVVLQKIGFWEVTKKQSPVGEDIVYLRNNAIGQVTLRDGTMRRPTLIIQCKGGTTDVYLDWKTKLIVPHVVFGQTMGIAYQIDTQPEVQEMWELALDKRALFSPEPVEFVKKLRQREKIVFNITSMYDSTRTVVHDISQLDTVLPLLVDRCYN